MAKVKLGKYEVDEEELDRQFIEATKRGAEELAKAPKAVAAKFDKKSKRMMFEMQNGITLLVPVNLVQGLQTSDDKALSDFELFMEGSEIHWETLDVQFRVGSFLKGIFGTPKWMEHLKQVNFEPSKVSEMTKKVA